jgi:hypothetical protein
MSVHPFVMVGQTPGRSTVAGVTYRMCRLGQNPARGAAGCPRAIRRGQLRNDSTEAANALGVAASDSSADVPLSSTLEFGRYCSDLVICVPAIHEVCLAA